MAIFDELKTDYEVGEAINGLVDSTYKQLSDRLWMTREEHMSKYYFPSSYFDGWIQTRWDPDGTVKGGENDMQNTSDFKIGDKLVLKKEGGGYLNSTCGNLDNDFEDDRVSYIIVRAKGSNDNYISRWDAYDSNNELVRSTCCGVYSQYFEKISSAQSFMQTLNILAKKLLDADTKALVKAGVLDDCLKVKDTEFILSFLVNLYKKDLAAEARALLKEQEDQTDAKA